MKLKKLQITAVALLMAATATYASSKEVYLIGGATDIEVQNSMTTYGFGYGGSNKDLSKSSQILYGLDLEFLAASTDMHSTQTAVNILLKAGYRYERLSMYGLGAMVYDGYTGTSALGFGYGGIVEFDVWRFDSSSKNIVMGAEYITASMTNAADLEYRSDTLTAFVKYVW